MIIRIAVLIFGLWVLLQIIFKYRDRKMSLTGLIFWLVLWAVIIAVANHPQITDKIAKLVGVGRGTDMAVFAAILILLYLIFRIYIKITEIESQISEVVKHIAIIKVKRKKIGKTVKGE